MVSRRPASVIAALSATVALLGVPAASAQPPGPAVREVETELPVLSELPPLPTRGGQTIVEEPEGDAVETTASAGAKVTVTPHPASDPIIKQKHNSNTVSFFIIGTSLYLFSTCCLYDESGVRMFLNMKKPHEKRASGSGLRAHPRTWTRQMRGRERQRISQPSRNV